MNGVTGNGTHDEDFGDYGSAEVLKIDDIKVDEEYQRALRHDLVNKIAQDYDVVKAGPILVSERKSKAKNPTLWVVDGQHRMAGALQAGETEIFAHVVHGLTQAQEADLRLARNDRRSDSQQEKWRTRMVMGDPKVEKITELLRQQGTQINLVPTVYKGINAIATVELIYDIDGTGVWLVRMLRVVKDAFGEEKFDPDHLSTSMMKSIVWFLGQHVDIKQVNYNEFIERLGAADVEDIRRKAVSHKAANGGALWLNYYRALVEIWNFRRQEKQKIAWQTTGSINRLGTSGVNTEAWRKGNL